MAILVAAATHQGLVRDENQDCLLVGGWVSSASGTLHSATHPWPGPALALAVLDGMGGHAGGALASLVAARALTQAIADHPAGSAEEHLAEAAARANLAVVDLATRVPGYAQMGTTMAVGVIGPDGVDLVNVGDSRIYRLRGGYLGQLSEDDRAPSVGERHALLSQSLGGTVERALDVHHLHLDPEPGQTLLLCTDGLHDYVDGADITTALGLPKPREAVQSLIRLALQAGAPDNVSVIVTRMHDPTLDVSPPAAPGPSCPA